MSPLPDPTIVMVEKVVGASGATVKVMTVWTSAVVGGLKLTVTPGGSPVAANEMGPVKPKRRW